MTALLWIAASVVAGLVLAPALAILTRPLGDEGEWM